MPDDGADPSLAKPESETPHPADMADHLESLPLEQQIEAVHAMPVEEAAESIAEMEDRARAELLKSLDTSVAATILSDMPPDEAADLLDELDPADQQRLLRGVTRSDAAEITDLMRYDPDTAGGIMNSQIVVLDQGLTADQAIKIIRREIEDKEIPYYAYLIDEVERLVGVMSLRDILLARPGSILKDLVRDQSLITVLFDVDKEEVAHQLSHYNFLALPVVDYDGRLLGMVTHDDVIDIIHEEASEDMLGMVGAGQDETVDTPWKRSVLQRAPWLVFNLGTSCLAALVVHMFEGTIAQMAILASLMGIVSNQAGNTGQQSLAVIIRLFAMERYDLARARSAVLREVRIGLATGLFMGLVVFGVAMAVLGNQRVAGVMGLAMCLDMALGALAGATIPVVLKVLGRDPAQASTIFLTMLTDSCGFLIFLSLASALLF
ncbi:MAG: magnesium transporter [Desulfovibrionaceae bacterium]|jgi:magnesium transporter|nr:magnesium transporter [Desulfovibrionaceae bacterium]